MLESSLSEQELVEVETTTPGSQLRSAREQAQLTVAVVAEELKLTVAYIESLENDDYEALPAEPFVLGYLRAYARLLGLDAQKVIENYHEYCNALLAMAGHLSVDRARPTLTVKPVSTPTKASEEQAAKQTGASKNYTGWIIAVCLLLWAVASMLMPETATPVVEPARQAPVEQAELDSVPAAVTQVDTDLVVEALSSEVDTPAELEAEVLETESVLVAEAPSAQAVNQHLAGLDTLQLDFLDECWLEVTDSRGDVLNADLYQSGDSKTLQGKAPFNVMLGNVRAVKARLNDEVLELNPNGFRKTLRLRITSTNDIEVLSRNPSVGDE